MSLTSRGRFPGSVRQSQPMVAIGVEFSRQNRLLVHHAHQGPRSLKCRITQFRRLLVLLWFSVSLERPPAAAAGRGVGLYWQDISPGQFLGLCLPVVTVALKVCDPLILALKFGL